MSEKNTNPNENYVVLARRTRPQSLSELAGQEVVTSSIENMLERKQIPHAFLLTGTRGTGKTSSARILAKSLCCEKGISKSPCQVCVHCKQITSSSHDDIIEIDGASHTGVDNIRELREATRFYPNSARYKIFIIDEVHMLSTGAFNALLKTLEEPPPKVVFILATTELNKVPITVRSRCMIFSFKKISSEMISSQLRNILLKENITFDDDALTLISREAKGSMRDALSLLEQTIAICGAKHISASATKNGLCLNGDELSEQLFLCICKKNIGEAIEILSQADTNNFDISLLIEQTSSLFRSAMIIKSLNQKERCSRIIQLLPQEYDFIESSTKQLSQCALSEIFKVLAHSVKEISRSSTSLSWAEIIVIDSISRADWLSPNEVLSPLPKQVNNVDMNLFKKLVENIEKKSKPLAAKLTFAKIEVFNSKTIKFLDAAENQTYLSFNEQDTVLFWSSLEEIGMSNVQFIGKYILKKNEPKQGQNLSRPLSVNSEKKFSTNKLEQNFTRLVASHSVPLQESTSLAEIQNREKTIEREEKEKLIMERDHIKDLKKLATEIHIVSLD